MDQILTDQSDLSGVSFMQDTNLMTTIFDICSKLKYVV